ncbi:hypothetical protein V2P57_01600 [Mycoplasma mycoides subsp. mycoides]|uniref:Uncharacterized protein n=1 Tax=Mycoplasma mycoides subsp. mycoides TaxID=2103 RepID=A0AAE2EHG4_MYCMY|nr:hypothetical protein [Mycoplasma mycoides]ADK69644.1 hypothetical protein MMS_A0352 [Mycoplasma mycoides subsp. mycoides SC str. Gladysdale]AIZ55174.1 Single stranded DNA binding protein (part of ICE) [Mycoplasma mycoides subsp. mycoides]AME10522.1 hypothetical protein MmmBen_0344 [Mycoplasma mycoides subsp. mycoides]AME11529.1 hypothetical protein MmmBen50_0339 [Mycoplasma mycoides subsp. mycoides]AME12553.1 hypothetical protein MmmBen181_0358 [Mycoplasma mycoides subsp. mycoides]
MNQVYLIGRLISDDFYIKEYEKPNQQLGQVLKFKIATLRNSK